MKKLLIAAAFVLILSTGATAMAAGTVPAVRKAAMTGITGRHHTEHSRHHFDRSFCGFVDNDSDGFCDNCFWHSDHHGSYCGAPYENNVPEGYGNNAAGTQSAAEAPAEPQPVAADPVDVQPAVESQPVAVEPQPVTEAPVESAGTYNEESTVPQSNGQYYGNGCYGYDSGTNSYGCGSYHSGHHGSGHHGRGHH